MVIPLFEVLPQADATRFNVRKVLFIILRSAHFPVSFSGVLQSSAPALPAGIHIQSDCSDNDKALDEFLILGRYAEQNQRIIDNAHEQSAENRSRYASFSACQVDAADNHRRQNTADITAGSGSPRHHIHGNKNHPSEKGGKAGKDISDNRVNLGRNTDKSGCNRIPADAVQAPAISRAPQNKSADSRIDQENNNGQRDS